jgi:hypothetical protein
MPFALIMITQKSWHLHMKLVRDEYDCMEWSTRLIKFTKENGIKY